MPTTTPAFAFAGAASDTAKIKASKPNIIFFSICLPSNFCTFKTQPEWKVAYARGCDFRAGSMVRGWKIVRTSGARGTFHDALCGRAHPEAGVSKDISGHLV